MKPIEASIEIDAPISQVFAVNADIPNAPAFIKDVVAVEPLTDQPVGLGYKWKETRVMFGKEASETMWITAFDPPSGYVVEAESHGCHYTTTIALSELADDRTRVTISFVCEPITRLAKIMSPMMVFMSKQIAKCFERDLADIKAHCEQAI